MITQIMRPKTHEQLEHQYKRLLQMAFPKLRFSGITWNWYKVYDEDPYQNQTFLRIHSAFISTVKKRQHPFYNH